jgi:hypothetical protein
MANDSHKKGKTQRRPGHGSQDQPSRNPDTRMRRRPSEHRQLSAKEDAKLEPERWDGLYT